MIKVNIDEHKLLYMLLDRLNYWTNDVETLELYEKMYWSKINDGLFESIEFDPFVIVDNDYISNCTVVGKDEFPEDFEKLLGKYNQGDYDITELKLEFVGGNHIEAVTDDKNAILISY